MSCRGPDGLILYIYLNEQRLISFPTSNIHLLMILLYFLLGKSNPFEELHMLWQKVVSHSETVGHAVVYCCFQKGDMTLCSAILIHTLQSNHSSPLSKCHPVSVWVSFHRNSVAFLFSQDHNTIFPVCKLLHMSGEDKLSIPYTNHGHPSCATVAFVVVIVMFHVVQISIWVTQFVLLLLLLLFIYCNWVCTRWQWSLHYTITTKNIQ
jgi:hypothetical protein